MLFLARSGPRQGVPSLRDSSFLQPHPALKRWAKLFRLACARLGLSSTAPLNELRMPLIFVMPRVAKRILIVGSGTSALANDRPRTGHPATEWRVRDCSHDVTKCHPDQGLQPAWRNLLFVRTQHGLSADFTVSCTATHSISNENVQRLDTEPDSSLTSLPCRRVN